MSNLERIGIREPTMRQALDLLAERGGRYIVETGCAREADNWLGDGMSTLVLGEWVAEHGGVLWTVDADPGNLATAKALSEEYASHINYVHDDSVHFLTEHEEPIDLLYLDSYDYPLMELVGIYPETGFAESIVKMRELGDAYLVSHHWDIIADSQLHALREITHAHLHDRSIVLIDDADLPGGGKARHAKLWLAENGWECLMDQYQTLWVHP